MKCNHFKLRSAGCIISMINSLDELELTDPCKPVGEGAFSKVHKCRFRNSRNFFALKTVA